RGRDLIGDLTFDCFLDDRGFSFTPGHHNHPSWFEDTAYPHRYCLLRHVLFTKEITRRVDACDLFECHQPGQRALGRSGFVKAYVAGATDTQYLDVDTPQLSNTIFIGNAIGCNLLFGNGAVRNVDVVARNVDMVEQVLVHKPNVTLYRIGLHRIVYVQVERTHMFEAEAFSLGPAYELRIHARRGRSRLHA